GVLIVGVPTDRIVRLKKGSERPFNSETERVSQIAAIDAVDYVVLYDELFPLTLIDAIKPIYYVKGQDTTKTTAINLEGSEVEIPESDSNPEISRLVRNETKLVVYCDDGSTSTTALIERIRRT